MKVAFHLGAPETDKDQLVRSLLANTELLLSRNTIVPRAAQVRKKIGHLFKSHWDAPAPIAAQTAFVRSLTRRQELDRIVFSLDTFLAAPGRILKLGGLYANAGQKTSRLRNILPDAEWEFFLAIRNPASFLPSVFYNQFESTLTDFLQGTDPRDILWSDVAASIAEHNPGVPLTVWCNEDTPVLWPKVLHQVSAIENVTPLEGGLDVINRIMSAEGRTHLSQRLLEHPPRYEDELHEILADHLERFAMEDAVEEEVELPGWTPDLVEELSEIYEDDLETIAGLPGVTFLEP